MDAFDAIEQRRSVKHYDPNHRLTVEEQNRILTLARLSPSAFNIQHVRFVVVEDEGLRQQLRKAAWNQAQVTDASLLIVVCADLKAWDKSPERYWRNAPAEIREKMVSMIGQFYRGRDNVQRDEAIRSCGIAAQTLMITAKAMGYDSCPMDGFDFEKAGKIINLPDDHIIALFVVIGKAVKEAQPRAGQLPEEEVIIKNQF